MVTKVVLSGFDVRMILIKHVEERFKDVLKPEEGEFLAITCEDPLNDATVSLEIKRKPRDPRD